MTIEANPESTQESSVIEVTPMCSSRDDDDRTQTVVEAVGGFGEGVPGDRSWDKIPILSGSHECTPENDRTWNPAPRRRNVVQTHPRGATNEANRSRRKRFKNQGLRCFSRRDARANEPD